MNENLFIKEVQCIERSTDGHVYWFRDRRIQRSKDHPDNWHCFIHEHEKWRAAALLDGLDRALTWLKGGNT